MIPLKTKRDRHFHRRLLVSIAIVSTIVLALAVFYWAPFDSASDATTTTPATRIGRGQIQIVDGDTIRANGYTYRLVGFDTPETVDAKWVPKSGCWAIVLQHA
jgi:endonuclease YncB( thermonuclease family)